MKKDNGSEKVKMSKEQDKEFAKLRIRQGIKNICNNHNIINKEELKKYEDKLYGEPYLPRLLLYELDDIKYLEMLEQMGNEEEYYKRLTELPHKMHKYDEIREFKEWVNKRDDYSELLNEKEYEQMEKEVSEAYQVYTGIMRNLLNEKMPLDEILTYG